MQVYKKIIKNYFKYEYNDWVQPVLTANGTIGGDSFAVSQVSYLGAGYEAFRAFDGSTSGFGSIFDKTTGYLEFYNPNPLKVTALKVLNFEGDKYGIRAITAGYIQVSNDGVDFSTLKEFTNSVVGGSQTWTIDLSNNTNCYKYYRIIATSTNYVNANAERQATITELTITAQEQIVVNGTNQDYDFYTEEEIYSLPTRINRKYYKYIYQDFIRPNLTANGTMGGDSFAVMGEQNAGSAYYAYDGNGSTFLQLFSNGVNETYFYNPKPLKISSLDFTYYPTTWITNGEVYGSNDGVNYDLLITFSHTSNSGSVEINNEAPYKYFKIKVLSANGSNGSIRVIADIYELKINAIEQLIIDSTEQDYDFYIDDTIYCAIN